MDAQTPVQSSSSSGTQAQRERQVPAGQLCRTRSRCRFYNTVVVKEIPSHRTYSASEKRATWYTKQDIRCFKIRERFGGEFSRVFDVDRYRRRSVDTDASRNNKEPLANNNTTPSCIPMCRATQKDGPTIQREQQQQQHSKNVHSIQLPKQQLPHHYPSSFANHTVHTVPIGHSSRQTLPQTNIAIPTVSKLSMSKSSLGYAPSTPTWQLYPSKQHDDLPSSKTPDLILESVLSVVSSRSEEDSGHWLDDPQREEELREVKRAKTSLLPPQDGVPHVSPYAPMEPHQASMVHSRMPHEMLSYHRSHIR